MGDKNKMEPNPFPFKCLEFTLFLEWYRQRTYLRGCCNKSIQQRRGRDAECRSCGALSKPCPEKMPSCPDCCQPSSFAGQFTPNGSGTVICHSEAAAALLDGWVLPINAPQLPPSSLLWHANDAQQNNTKMGLSHPAQALPPSQPDFQPTCLSPKLTFRLSIFTRSAIGKDPDLMDCSVSFAAVRSSDQKPSILKESLGIAFHLHEYWK